MVIEKAVRVWIGYCNGLAIFSTFCEVVDTDDPEVKIFRFKEGCKWGAWDGSKDPRSVKKLAVGTVGECEGRYRVTAALDVPPGYVAILEGTTKPETAPEESAPVNETEVRCELAIIAALDTEPRMTLRTLKRKVSSHRFPAFDECLKRLADQGELSVSPDPAQPQRTWVSAVGSKGAVSVSNGNADSDVTEQ